jgi:GAF domain-containing protein
MKIDRIGQVTKSWLGVPMLAGDQVLGVITLQNYEINRAYTENDLNLLSTIAAQAAIALQNIYLLHDTKVQADEMRHLYELGVSISQEFDLHQILKQVVQEALNLTSSQLGTIWVWDSEQQDYITEGLATSPVWTKVVPRTTRLLEFRRASPVRI